MSKQFWIALLVIAGILGGIVAISNHGKHTNSSSTQPTSHTTGTSPAGVTLLEYGDYECPVCGSFYPSVKQATDTYNDRVVFQFRHLPLVSIHQNAFASSRAAEAAGLQGKYWEMHDQLYQNQSAWATSSSPQPIFDNYAASIGLNTAQFDRDYASDAVNNAINADLAAFAKTGDDMATPTFYLNGKKVDNNQLVDPQTGQPSPAAFRKVLDAALAKKP